MDFHSNGSNEGDAAGAFQPLTSEKTWLPPDTQRCGFAAPEKRRTTAVEGVDLHEEALMLDEQLDAGCSGWRGNRMDKTGRCLDRQIVSGISRVRYRPGIVPAPVETGRRRERSGICSGTTGAAPHGRHVPAAVARAGIGDWRISRGRWSSATTIFPGIRRPLPRNRVAGGKQQTQNDQEYH